MKFIFNTRDFTIMSFATQAMVDSQPKKTPDDTAFSQINSSNFKNSAILASLAPHVPSDYSCLQNQYLSQSINSAPPSGPLATHCAVPYFQNSPYGSFAISPYDNVQRAPEVQSQIKVISCNEQTKTENERMNVNNTASEITKGFLKSTGTVETKRIGNLEENVKKLHSELQHGLKRDQNLHTRISEMECVSSEIKHLNAKINNMKNEANHNSISKMRAELSTLERKMTTQLKNLEMEHSNVDSRVTKMTTSLTSLQNDSTTHMTNIKKLHTSLNSSIEDVNKLKNNNFKSLEKPTHSLKSLTKLVEERKK